MARKNRIPIVIVIQYLLREAVVKRIFKFMIILIVYKFFLTFTYHFFSFLRKNYFHFFYSLATEIVFKRM